MNVYKDDADHSGHRTRLTKLINNTGMDSVSEIQAVEYFLTYIFPRGDVNPLAHRLLNRYGNFANIVDASLEDLIQTTGINERSAMKIKNFNQIMDYYITCRMKKKINLKNNSDLLDYLEMLLRFKKVENLYLFAIDISYNLIEQRCLAMNNIRKVGINPMDLYNFISSTKLHCLVVAHNHPGGTAYPSKDDGEAVKYLDKLLAPLNIRLVDSLIVGADGVYSERSNGFLRHFQDIDTIIDFVQRAQNEE